MYEALLLKFVAEQQRAIREEAKTSRLELAQLLTHFASLLKVQPTQPTPQPRCCPA